MIDNVTYSYFHKAKEELNKAPDDKKLEKIAAAINFTAASGSILEPVVFAQHVTQAYLKEETDLIPENQVRIGGKWNALPQNTIVGIIYAFFDENNKFNMKSVRKFSHQLTTYPDYISDRDKNKIALTKVFTGIVEYLIKFQKNMNTHYESVKKPTIPLLTIPSPIIAEDKMDLLLDSLEFLFNYLKYGKKINNRNKRYNLYNADGTDANKLVVTFLNEIVESFNPLRDTVVAQQTSFKNTETMQMTNAGCTCISDCIKHKTGIFSSDKFCLVLPKSHNGPNPELQCEKAGIKTPTTRVAGIKVHADIKDMSRCGNPIPSPQTGGIIAIMIFMNKSI